MRMSLGYGFVRPEKVSYPRSMNASPKLYPHSKQYKEMKKQRRYFKSIQVEDIKAMKTTIGESSYLQKVRKS